MSKYYIYIVYVLFLASYITFLKDIAPGNLVCHQYDFYCSRKRFCSRDLLHKFTVCEYTIHILFFLLYW